MKCDRCGKDGAAEVLVSDTAGLYEEKETSALCNRCIEVEQDAGHLVGFINIEDQNKYIYTMPSKGN